METSVVICTRNQAPRLALVLRSLSLQSLPPAQVVVVDDASTDETAELLERAGGWFGDGVLCPVRNVARLGSPGARNAGAARASGELLVFLDSDALPTHRHLERHAALHRRAGRVACFGPLRHTTTTEYFRDPRTGEPFAGLEIPESTAARMRRDPASMRITEDDVARRFASIVDRSAPGAYPHLGWMEELGETQTEARTSASAWVLMSPQNFSVRREAFEAVGGFDATLPFCEGWDLMLCLRAAGAAPCRIGDAPIFHIYHHHAFEDLAQTEIRWRAMISIAEKHRQRALVLALLLYAYAGGDPYLPRPAGPRDIEHLDALLRVHVADDLGPYATLLARHPVLSDIVGDWKMRPPGAAHEPCSPQKPAQPIVGSPT